MGRYNSLYNAKSALKRFKFEDKYGLSLYSVILFDDEKKRWVIGINLKRYKCDSLKRSSTIYIPFMFKGVPIVIHV